MKSMISTIIFTLIGLQSLGWAGGVTVGNGSRISAGLSLKKDFKTEAQLKRYAESTIKNIRRNQHKRVSQMIYDGACDNDYRKVNRFYYETFYPVKNNRILLKTEYVGYLIVELRNCESVDKIKADTPFGGKDLWDLDVHK